jgi:hypothetical protein
LPLVLDLLKVIAHKPREISLVGYIPIDDREGFSKCSLVPKHEKLVNGTISQA